MESFTYDPLGRVLTESSAYDTDPAQLVKTTVYDRSRIDTETGPTVTNPISNAQHQLQID